MKSIFLSLTFFIAILSIGCPTIPITENPTNPEADDPLELGEEAVTPIGCIQWQVREGEKNADC